VLYDRDTIGIENLNRLMVPPVYVGCNKALALRAEIARFRPDLDVIVVPEFLTLDHVSDYLLIAHGIRHRNVIVFYDCTDDITFQKELSTEVNKRSLLKLGDSDPAWSKYQNIVLYIRCSYNGLNHITVTERTAGRVLNPELANRYTVTPSWGVPAMLAGVLAVYHTIYQLTVVYTYISTHTRCDSTMYARELARAYEKLLPRIRLGNAIFDLTTKERSKYE